MLLTFIVKKKKKKKKKKSWKWVWLGRVGKPKSKIIRLVGPSGMVMTGRICSHPNRDRHFIRLQSILFRV